MKDEDEAWWKRPVGDPERGLFVHLMTTSEPLRVGIRRGLENVVWIDIDEVNPYAKFWLRSALILCHWRPSAGQGVPKILEWRRPPHG